MLHDLFFRLRTLMRRPVVENELDDELHFHLSNRSTNTESGAFAQSKDLEPRGL